MCKVNTFFTDFLYFLTIVKRRPEVLLCRPEKPLKNAGFRDILLEPSPRKGYNFYIIMCLETMPSADVRGGQEER